MENGVIRETEPELMYWTPLEQKCAVYRGQLFITQPKLKASLMRL
jgi:hypothetical protein